MSRQPHLDPGLLADVALGEKVSAGARLHLRACERCRVDLEEVAATVAALRADRAPRPGAALVERAYGVFAPAPARPRPVPETLGRRLGRDREAALTMRGTLEGRRQLFTGAGLDVDLALSSHRGAIRLRGQALARRAGVRPVEVLVRCQGRVWATSPVGARGHFAFPALPAGPFDLLVDLGGRRLLLRPDSGDRP